jgi:hypothetical protein
MLADATLYSGTREMANDERNLHNRQSKRNDWKRKGLRERKAIKRSRVVEEI